MSMYWYRCIRNLMKLAYIHFLYPPTEGLDSRLHVFLQSTSVAFWGHRFSLPKFLDRHLRHISMDHLPTKVKSLDSWPNISICHYNYSPLTIPTAPSHLQHAGIPATPTQLPGSITPLHHTHWAKNHRTHGPSPEGKALEAKKEKLQGHFLFARFHWKQTTHWNPLETHLKPQSIL